MAKKPKRVEEPPKKEKTRKSVKPEEPVADPLKPTRGRVIGDNFGWTGKLPATLLNEYAQKQKWGRVEYDIWNNKSSKGPGLMCTVRLSWVNPRTNENIVVRMTPDLGLYNPKETSNEARHFGATYAMFRINFIKNMKMVLPSVFADYWGDLEKERQLVLKENKQKHDRIYNANPFGVVLEERERTEKLAKEKLVQQQNEMKIKKPTISISTKKAPSATPARTAPPVHLDKLPSFPRKVWDNAPFIDFPSDIRTSIEHSIRKHIDWILQDEMRNPLETSADSKQFMETLTQLEFRESHIREAFKYTSTFTDALEWLLFHLPEDDLPRRFAKTDRDSGVLLKISKNIQQEYLLKRLRQSGVDEDEILSTLEECANDEVKTCVKLTRDLLGDENEITDNEDPDSHELWVQEIEGIELLGSNKVQFVEGYDQKVADISLNAEKLPKGTFSLRVFKSPQYPNDMPGLQIIINTVNQKLADYIKLSIIKQVGEYLVKNMFVGDCFIYCIIEWLEQNIHKVIDNPGPLIGEELVTKEILSKVAGSKRAGKQAKSGTKVHKLLPKDIEELKKSYTSRLATSKMKQSLSQRSKLPAWSKKDQLVSVINSNQVTLVTGETGSGKSTQIVQFILDELNASGNFESRIICTQPRRISTIGLAERISDERIDQVGKETGYIIRGENRTSKVTRLSFVTTGVLLRMLQSFLSSGSKDASLFENLEYIFIDEVHERSIDSDFLLIILKNILDKFPNLKVILMSATIDISTFKNFFKTPLNHIHIEGRTFPIEDHYLDSILEDLDYTVQTSDGELIRPKATSAYFQKGNLNYDLVARLCLKIDSSLSLSGDKGSILIFLPGIMEINRCIREIENLFRKQSQEAWCLPLHSALSSGDQKKVFQSPKNGARKIVVSTNIAETSITIPDCVVVIDSGRSKTIFFDNKINTTKLVENWCSKAEIGQRRGRSGRITNGTCYHLYTKDSQDLMLAQPIPEIKRTRLENLYLIVKSMGISNVENFLNQGLDAPDLSSLGKSKKFLSDIGALDHEQLTHLGKYLSFLPTDLQSGKLLIFGCIFGCLDTCLTLAAISSTGSPIMNNFEMRDRIKQIKSKFSAGNGDLIAMVNAFNEYEQSGNSKKFLQENCLSYLTIKEIKSTRMQYISILQDLGFVPTGYKNDPALNRNNTNYVIIRSIITGAYYPQIAQVQFPDPKFFKSLAGAVAVDPDAKKNKYWLRNDSYKVGDQDQYPATRAFMHPSSVNFSSKEVDASFSQDILDRVTDENGEIDYEAARKLYDLTPQTKKTDLAAKAPFMVYRDSNHTDKFYLREVTPTSTLATLLFGGDIEYDLVATKSCPGVVVDRWLPVRTWCKNAVLIKRLRKLLDGFIDEKLSQPHLEANQDVLRIVERALNV
ncbi:P-loop containing nucleoside triphosphate hydrolase protein [Suhomyces tanzawaensis NRRL Y-17324]|uniref:p-loop containing nucleoside triphosphate hydrolase protein n=1 Tax=Suhomyces tanzawaensis NRRL Y-17324 TaxID=984487 RepID=A0A1E4SIK9_9ASCO|nr:P-loop containing nucleoside triphosphate hydrolase protein [Suhomyces tanzawaensis NRRL Y-17324]ODV79345.1 P-loop containing nucleoside triphosphate hydrolase protein [Suhomyces tanzawaensis NRRL Y-17324]